MPNSNGDLKGHETAFNRAQSAPAYDFDDIIVGSGFGGSVSALRLAEKGYSVGVMEMGRRWQAEDFPKSNWDARRYFWRPGLRMFGFFNMRLFRHVVVMCGNAVGGGSIAYASALLKPSPEVWDQGSWAGLLDWKRVMPQHYASAERMLGVADNTLLGEADRRLEQMARMVGVADSFYPGRSGTFFPPPGEAGGKTYPDPYFGGEGPARSTCIGCGGCLMGCQYNAKNSLDKNYLYLAEKRGAQVFAETRVVDVRPLNGQPDGRDGYEVHTESSTALFNKQRRVFRCRRVIFAASSLGTVELLLRLKARGSLPRLSDDLGKRIRTNAESLIGLRFPGRGPSMSLGIAGGAAIYLDAHTHIGVVRYAEGVDATSLLMTVMRGAALGWRRVPAWAWRMLRHPLQAWRAHNPIGFAHQTMLFVVMQNKDAHIDMRLKRRWYWPFSPLLCSEGEPIAAHIPEANAFIEKAAKALGGIPMSLLTETLFNIPTTAHCMGGCAMADSPQRGVMDVHNRVFGYQNMLICDGSMLSANLGVNPSLTITALAEHAMSHIPIKSSLTSTFKSTPDEQTTHE
ncbi:MAG: GMC oxidoreductase [Limnohabitans sp.]